MKVLIVDDSELTIRGVTRELEAVGWEVESRTRIIGTIATILKFKPDVVLLDISMPGGEGQHFVKLIVSSIRIPPCVLFYSERSEEELKELTREFKAYGFVRKADSIGRLARIIEQFVRSFKA